MADQENCVGCRLRHGLADKSVP